MRRYSTAVVPLVGLIVLGACSGRDSTGPRNLTADGADYAATVVVPATTCDFTAISKAAKNYFTSGNDAVYGYLKSMSSAYKTGGAASATPCGWSALGQVSLERLTSLTTNGRAGAIFVIDVLRCMADLSDAQHPQVPLQLPSGFDTTTVALILNSGIWEIRDGGTAEGPAVARVSTDTVAFQRAFGLPRWGVETKTVSTLWPAPTTNPNLTYAVYGYPKKLGNPLGTDPTTIDYNDVRLAAYTNAGVAPFNAFELGSVPYNLPRTDLRVGICAEGDVTVGNGILTHLVHNNSEILGSSPPGTMCTLTDPLVASASAPQGWYAMFVKRALSVFQPSVLFAQDIQDCTDCIGGLPSGWTPFARGDVNASSLTDSITVQPSDPSAVSSINSLVVEPLYLHSSPVPQVTIDSITVSNNSGTPAGAVITCASVPYAPYSPPGPSCAGHPTDTATHSDGTLTIYFQVGKAGGYLVTVWASQDGVQIPPVTSTLFNVKNQ